MALDVFGYLQAACGSHSQRVAALQAHLFSNGGGNIYHAVCLNVRYQALGGQPVGPVACRRPVARGMESGLCDDDGFPLCGVGGVGGGHRGSGCNVPSEEGVALAGGVSRWHDGGAVGNGALGIFARQHTAIGIPCQGVTVCRAGEVRRDGDIRGYRIAGGVNRPTVEGIGVFCGGNGGSSGYGGRADGQRVARLGDSSTRRDICDAARADATIRSRRGTDGGCEDHRSTTYGVDIEQVYRLSLRDSMCACSQFYRINTIGIRGI